MKRLLALMLCLILLMPAAAFAEATEPSLTEKLLDRWFHYIGAKDELLSNDLLLSDQTLAYIENPTWENLICARAAASAVLSDRNTLAGQVLLPELTDAEYAELAAKGIMVDVAREETPDLNEYASVELLELLEWSTTLHGNCFDHSSAQWLAELAQLKKQSALYERQWYIITTNALLSSLNNEAAALSIWEQLPELYPCIFGEKPDFISLLADTEPVAEQTILDLESQISSYQAHLGQGENELNNMRYAAFAKEPYFSVENMILVENAPLLLPLAPWHGQLGTELFTYYTIDDEGSLIRLTTEFDLSVQPPMIECIYTTDVEKSAVIAYADWLGEIGLSYTQSSDDSDALAWSRTFDVGAGDLMIRWENGSVSLWNIGMEVMFIPDWYAVLLSLE